MNLKKITIVTLAIAAYLGVAYFALGIRGFIVSTRTLRTETKDADNVATNTDPAALMAACRKLLDDHHHQPATLVSETYVKLFPETDNAKQPRIGTNIPPALLALTPTVIEIASLPNNIVVRLRPHARNLIIYDEHNSLTNELWYFNGCDSESGYILLRREFENQPDNK
jgi:hypothetical protein